MSTKISREKFSQSFLKQMQINFRINIPRAILKIPLFQITDPFLDGDFIDCLFSFLKFWIFPVVDIIVPSLRISTNTKEIFRCP